MPHLQMNKLGNIDTASRQAEEALKDALAMLRGETRETAPADDEDDKDDASDETPEDKVEAALIYLSFVRKTVAEKLR